MSRKFQTSRSLPDLSLDNGHVDTDNGHATHTEYLLSVLNHSHPLVSEVYGSGRVHSHTIASVVDDMDEEDSLDVRSLGATRV